METMTGYLVYSLSGHDKGRVYMIVGEEKDYVYLADGDTRTAAKPKRKNKKHIQIIRKLARKEDAATAANEEIKHIIKMFCKGMEE